VDTFDYSDLTGAGSPVTIEELAGLLGGHVRQVLEETGARQVDIVAHSMGGLLTRAWMSGMLANLQIPYERQIRKLVLIGTPNYGAAAGLLNGACSVAIANLGCSGTQARQMRFGSTFILTLHDRWANFQRNSQHRIPEQNILLIAGTRGSSDTGIECRDIASPEGCDDGIVDISSAILPGSAEERIRYVPYRHSDLPIISPLGGITLVGVNDNQHATYRLVVEFLKNGTVLGQCCGEDTVDYNPPHLRGVSRLREGLLIMRLVDGRTGRPIKVKPHIVRPIRQDFLQQGNKDGGAVSAWGMKAPKRYDITVSAKGYTRRAFRNIRLNVARPTVSKPLKLIPR
ncbi:MAG: lipase family alpha/beta hydrolase, partial [Pyrinomonadaceae bacterium]